MRHLICLFATLSLFFIFVSCQKDKHDPARECQQLQMGITTGDTSLVKEVITAMVYRLPSRKYTAANLDKLAETIGQQCGVTARRTCFDCEYSMTPNSKLSITIAGNTPVQKTINIRNDKRDEIVFFNMYD